MRWGPHRIVGNIPNSRSGHTPTLMFVLISYTLLVGQSAREVRSGGGSETHTGSSPPHALHARKRRAQEVAMVRRGKYDLSCVSGGRPAGRVRASASSARVISGRADLHLLLHGLLPWGQGGSVQLIGSSRV